MSDEPDAVCVGVRVSEDPDMDSTIPSFQSKCVECGEMVWLSKRTSGPLIENGAVAMCMQCVMPRLDETTDIRPAPGAFEEFFEAMWGKDRD